MVMLKNHDSSAIVAVRDLDRARRFYADTLGLELIEDGDVLTFRTGATRLNVYASDEAGTNTANAVVWGCGNDLDEVVAALSAKGVTFEHYPDMPEVKLDGDIHRFGDFGAAWFKDPDGNILHVNSG
jgi:catechol 2,3-dioxygenase-like lactoylglutathione lyase family enzyme